jgi:predicted enzyme related to lactoylglutathione lyase
MKVKVRNTKRFQKFYDKVLQWKHAKIVKTETNEKGHEYVVVDMTYYAVSMGADIEAGRLTKTIVEEYNGVQITEYVKENGKLKYVGDQF